MVIGFLILLIFMMDKIKYYPTIAKIPDGFLGTNWSPEMPKMPISNTNRCATGTT